MVTNNISKSLCVSFLFEGQSAPPQLEARFSLPATESTGTSIPFANARYIAQDARCQPLVAGNDRPLGLVGRMGLVFGFAVACLHESRKVRAARRSRRGGGDCVSGDSGFDGGARGGHSGGHGVGEGDGGDGGGGD
ncbi:hypothetical protein V7S43_010530 [Phytophthora oleae]|uniref:Uncharacterized protein n=1 Tax=Phytophthora oleae TaxID=2107226 RepID=A0ABD3FD29_9STRA